MDELRVTAEQLDTLWANVLTLMDGNEVVTLDLVLRELEWQEVEGCLARLRDYRGRPSVVRWKTLLDPPARDVLQRVLNDFSGMSGVRGTRVKADPYLVTLAVVEGRTVVTEENRDGRRQKIPSACDAFEVECINLTELIVRERLVE